MIQQPESDRTRTSDTISEAIRQQCWDNALYAYGTAYIFKQRALRVRWKIRWLSFLGLAVPFALGGIALTALPDLAGKTLSDSQAKFLSYFLYIGGGLSSVQFVMTAWSMAQQWDDRFAYSRESQNANQHLSTEFTKLAQNPPADIDRRFELLSAEYEARCAADDRELILDKENRKGMRYALRQFQRQCAGCNIIPKDMQATDCGTCGKF